MSRMLTAPAALLVILPLAGCSTLTPVSSKGAIDAFKPISSSKADTCQTQREVAEHNSRYDTLKRGAVIVYKAQCDVVKPDRVASNSKS